MSCCQILSQSHVSCGYGMERPPPVGYQCMTRSCWGTKLSFLRRKSAAKPMGDSLVGVGEAHLYRDSMTAHPSEHWKGTQALAEEAHSQHRSQALLISSSLFIRAGARETAGGRWRLGNGARGTSPTPNSQCSGWTRLADQKNLLFNEMSFHNNNKKIVNRFLGKHWLWKGNIKGGKTWNWIFLLYMEICFIYMNISVGAFWKC